MNSKKLLIVGDGSIGKKHNSIAASHAFIDEIRQVGQRAFHNEMKGGVTHESREKLERLVGYIPDIAIVAGPATSHVSTALILISLKIHIVIEKPLSHDLSELDHLFKLANEQGSRVSIGYNLRYSQSLEYFKQCVDDAIVGRILSIRSEVGQFLPDWRPGQDYRDTVSANSTLGGGVLLELSHEIDYLQWIFGPVQSVSSVTLNCSDLEIDVEDAAHILLFMDTAYDNKRLIASVNLDFVRRDTTRGCFAIGEHGTLKWDGVADAVSLYDVSQGKWRTLMQADRSKTDSYERALQHFLECVDNNDEPLVTLYDGIRVLNVVDAIRKSSEQHCRICTVES